MKDEDKTKEQLIKELKELRKRINELEATKSERKKVEKALWESEDKYRDLFENANDMIQSVDTNGSFVYVNRKWLDTLGYSKDESKELKLTDILREDQIPHCMELFKRVRSGESVEKVETVFVTKDGQEIVVEGNANAQIKDGKFIATRGIFRNITERKKCEEERISRKKLEAINNVVVALNHEMNQPLTVICMNAEILLNEIEKDSKLYEDLKIIHKAAWRLANLVRKTQQLRNIKTTEYTKSVEMIDLSHDT